MNSPLISIIVPVYQVEKYLEKKIEDGTVSEELTFSLEELGLDASKGFFKVEVKQ